MKSTLLKDTAIYGLSSIVGRFLNYLLVPLYTHVLPKDEGAYGISTNIYAYTALMLVILTFGMETTLFRFANKGDREPDTVFSTAFTVVGTLTALFLLIIFGFINPIATTLGYAAHPEYLLLMATVVGLDALQALPFSYLRFQKRPIKFATLKLLFIIVNIALNCLYFLILRKTDVLYIFTLNLTCTSFITFFFIPDLLKIRWHFDGALLKDMLKYSWPILILGIVGALNQTIDKIIFPLIYPDTTNAQVQLGVYGACVKIAMIMAMITQAFRYAYEPIVFAKSQDKKSKDYYAKAMKYFIIFTLFAFLCVVGYMDILKLLIGNEYREGLRVIPIVMAAEIMMGIYFNLSFWYKLIDKTIWGAWFSLAGCAVLLAVNILFIPRYGYMACAWGGFAGYATSMTLSYIIGQKKNPIKYPVKIITAFTLLSIAIFAIMTVLSTFTFTATPWLNTTLHLTLNTLLILLFALMVLLDLRKGKVS